MHLRPIVIALAAGTLLACFAASASAQQVYKWKDAQGVTHFSQSPPASGTDYTRVHMQGQRDINEPTRAPAQRETASNDDADSGHAPARSNGPASSTQPDTAANRAKLCSQLNSNIALLQGKQPVVTEQGGKQTVMSDDAREQQLANARAQQSEYCKH